MNTARYLSVAPHVRVVRFPSVTAILDCRTGTVEAFTGDTARIWAAIEATGDPTTRIDGVDEVTANHVLRSLRKRGFLVAVSEPQQFNISATGQEPPASWGTRDSPAALEPIRRPPLAWSLAAAGALTAVLIIRGLGPRQRRFARLRRLATDRRPPRAADETTARDAVHAVRRIGRVIPARVACLEESVAVVLVLRAAGYRTDWRHGAATDPIRLHAWVEIDGRPIDEPADITDYTPFKEPT